MLLQTNHLHGSVSLQQCTYGSPSIDAHVLMSRIVGCDVNFYILIAK